MIKAHQGSFINTLHASNPSHRMKEAKYVSTQEFNTELLDVVKLCQFYGEDHCYVYILV